MKSEINLKLIKEQREKNSFSMKEMAETLGFKNASTYLKYETGEYSFKAEMLPILSKKLKIPFKDFFTHVVAKTEITKQEVS